jgi:hypothetical protein
MPVINAFMQRRGYKVLLCDVLVCPLFGVEAVEARSGGVQVRRPTGDVHLIPRRHGRRASMAIKEP